jgi:sugar lactone lactonase YvrE
VCRVIGTGDMGFNGEGLPALESWLYFPSVVRVAPDGRLVVVDFNNMRIRAVDPDGTLVTIAGSGDHAWSTPGAGVLETALENPVDVVFADDGRFFIAAQHEARVLLVDADGNVTPYAGTGDEGYAGDGGPADAAWLSELGGIAIARDAGAGDTLYLSDTGNNCIRVVDPDGTLRTLAGAPEPGFVDGAGTDARFSAPQRIDYADGAVYVADAFNHAVRRVDAATGAVTTVAGTGTPGYTGDGEDARLATLNYPYGVTVDRTGGLLVADSLNNVVRRIDADGIITTVAGTGEKGLSGDDAPALSARFDFPVHAIADDAGGFYVADQGNGVVRRWSDTATE